MKIQRNNRQSFLGKNSEEIISNTVVGVVGLGGGGSQICQQLAHIGIGNFVLFDPDTIDPEGTNLNRLVGATEKDVQRERAKTEIAKRLIQSVNKKAVVEVFKEKWQEKFDALKECDVIFGSVDLFSDRLELEAFARRYLIPYIDIGMDIQAIGGTFVVGGQVALSIPGDLCLKCFGFLREDRDQPNYGLAGHRPQVIWPLGTLVSGAVGLFMGLITPWQGYGPRGVVLEYDGNNYTLQIPKKFEYLYSSAHHCGHFPLDEVGDQVFA